jgi:hypothetical protein
VLFVGDDWAEDHHDIELQDEAGRVLGRAKVPEGIAGIARLHAMIGEQLGEGDEPGEVVIGIETDRGPWSRAIIAARVPDLRDQPAAGRSAPGTPRGVPGQERHWRCACLG